jgi:spermidine/putrescine transport system ATP-binding protein
MKKVHDSEISRRVDETLRLVRLEGYGERRPKQLSGGQQQRVALARALINHPEVLLLDEPLGALDMKLRKEMQLELKHLQQHVGITFIYVTHDQEEALVMSDRIAVMSRGRVLQVGTPTEIYERPTTRFVADFIGETNFLEGRLVEVDGVVGRVTLPSGHNIQGRAFASIPPGADVSLSVRPEKIRISDQPLNGQPNTFQVRVAEVAYIGSDTRIRVEFATGERLDVWEQNTLSTLDKDAYYAPGDDAWISWTPRNALILGE